MIFTNVMTTYISKCPNKSILHGFITGSYRKTLIQNHYSLGQRSSVDQIKARNL